MQSFTEMERPEEQGCCLALNFLPGTFLTTHRSLPEQQKARSIILIHTSGAQQDLQQTERERERSKATLDLHHTANNVLQVMLVPR